MLVLFNYGTHNVSAHFRPSSERFDNDNMGLRSSDESWHYPLVCVFMPGAEPQDRVRRRSEEGQDKRYHRWRAGQDAAKQRRVRPASSIDEPAITSGSAASSSTGAAAPQGLATHPVVGEASTAVQTMASGSGAASSTGSLAPQGSGQGCLSPFAQDWEGRFF